LEAGLDPLPLKSSFADLRKLSESALEIASVFRPLARIVTDSPDLFPRTGPAGAHFLFSRAFLTSRNGARRDWLPAAASDHPDPCANAAPTLLAFLIWIFLAVVVSKGFVRSRRITFCFVLDPHVSGVSDFDAQWVFLFYFVDLSRKLPSSVLLFAYPCAGPFDAFLRPLVGVFCLAAVCSAVLALEVVLRFLDIRPRPISFFFFCFVRHQQVSALQSSRDHPRSTPRQYRIDVSRMG